MRAVATHYPKLVTFMHQLYIVIRCFKVLEEIDKALAISEQAENIACCSYTLPQIGYIHAPVVHCDSLFQSTGRD